VRTGKPHIQATPARRDGGRAGRAIAAWWRAALFVAVVFGQGLAGAQQLSLRHYGKAEGLDNLNVNCMLQARDGFFWACTENGLFRYDGQRFQRFGEDEGLENTLVYTAIQDAAGRLWAATSSDLYVGDGGRFQAVRPEGRPLRTTPDSILAALPNGDVALAIRGQAVLVSAGPAGSGWRSAPMFTPSQLAAMPELGKIDGLYAAPDGHLWLGCGLDVCDAVDGQVHRHSRSRGVPQDRWRSFALDARGDLWARGKRFAVRLKRGEQVFVRQAVPNAVLRASVDMAPIVGASDGSVVMRVDKGIARWRDGTWSLWTAANGLPSPDVTTLTFDHEGALWLGLVGRGASRLVGYGRIESWTSAQGLDSDVVWSLLRRDDGALLASTSGSCRRLERGAARLRPCAIPGLAAGEIGALAQDRRGSLWIGFRAGELWVLERGAPAARFVARLPHFTSIFVDSRERLWVPTRGGVFLKLPGDAAPRLVGEDHEFLDAAEDAQGRIWVAGSDGLLRFAEGAWKHAALTDRRAAPGFASLAIDRNGIVWAASRSRGVMRAALDGDELREQHWVEDPLVANASPMFIRIDTAGRIWVGTDYGVVVHEAPGRAGAPEWQRLTETDGLVWNDVNQSSFAADADGSVWIGTSGGLSHVVDPDLALTRKPLQLQLGGGRFAGRHFVPEGSQRWEWSRSSALDLDLVSLNFGRSMDSVFRYRVVGVDGDWFESGNPRVHYPAIEPGRYRFEASLLDPDRRQSSAVIGFDFEVLPPWWRSTWFRALCVGAGLLGLLAAWRWQLRRITARHLMEQQIAKERHLLLERASRDALTGLWNRASILDLLNEAVTRRAPGTALGVAVIDVDHFKRVNDEHGHAAGDVVLKELAQRLSANLRPSDLLGRYGGEELLLVLPCRSGEPLAGMVERLRDAVCHRPFSLGERTLEVTVSIGVAWLGAVDADADAPPLESAQQAFERADAALYEAKRAGRNRVVFSRTDPLEARRGDD